MLCSKKIAIAACAAVLAVALCGCTPQSGSSVAGQSSGTMKVGTMPTEDFLPMWVAEQEGLFGEADMNVELVKFDSAQALSAAITAGEVDLAMTDIMRSVKLTEAGTPMQMEWITLGAESSQGVFGVMAASDATYSTLAEMAEYAASESAPGDFGVGVAANTVPEYVFDKLCEQAGIEPGVIQEVEVASLPERYSLMATGKLGAAALPASFIALGEANGMKLLASDATGDNISQSVMVSRTKYANANAAQIEKLAKVWDTAVALLAADPAKYKQLLADNANLNSQVASTYIVSSYPYALNPNGGLAHPEDAQVQPLLKWMESKGYVSKNIEYNQSTGDISAN